MDRTALAAALAAGLLAPGGMDEAEGEPSAIADDGHARPPQAAEVAESQAA